MTEDSENLKAMKRINISMELEKTIKSITAQKTTWDKMLSSMKNPPGIDNAFRSLATQKSAFDKMLYAMQKPIGIDNALQSIVTQKSALDKMLYAMQKPVAIDKALQSIAAQKTAWDKMFYSIQKPTGIDKVLQSIATQKVAWDKMLYTMIKPSGIDKAIQEMAVQKAAWDKLVSTMQNAAAIKMTIDSIIKPNSTLLHQANILSEMKESFTKFNFNDESIIEDEIDTLLVEASRHFSLAKNSRTFIEVFKKLPPLLQAFIYFIMLNVFLPQINNIASNLITPHIETFLKNSHKTNKENINEIKKIPHELNCDNIQALRFITGNNVRLRKSASTNAEILDELLLGQIVIVLSKKKNWIQVECEYEDGEVLTGWVFTRYTAKFHKY